jgi:hypothetical protein
MNNKRKKKKRKKRMNSLPAKFTEMWLVP